MSGEVRVRNRLVLFKLQTESGLDAAPTPAEDALGIEQDGFTKSVGFTTEDTNEATGSLDAGEPLIVGEPATVNFRSRLRGAGVAYTGMISPRLGRPLQTCGWAETFTDAIAAAALTDGTALDATLGASFPGVDQALRGMPIIIGGGNHAGRRPVVLDYTAARLATLSESFNPALSIGETAELPANYRYQPFTGASIDDIPLATIWVYEDGKLYKFIDCRGDFTLTVSAGRVGFLDFAMTGIFTGRTEPGMPAGAVFESGAPPFFRQGTVSSSAFLIDRQNAAISQMTLRGGNTVGAAPNPNTQQGFDGGIVSNRDVRLEVDPRTTDLATRDVIADLESGTKRPYAAQWGNTPGARMFVSLPSGMIIGRDEADQQGLQTETLTVDATGQEGAVAALTFA